MTTSASASPRSRPTARTVLNKVPEVTLYFWIIKILCTTVGETFADYLNTTLGLGLNGTTAVMSVLLAVVLVVQFRRRGYAPAIYWLAVVLISVVGTLITDNMVDNLGISLPVSTVLFSVVLAATFAAWYASEKTLSIHTILTVRREAFYWLTVLFTFALGTAAGDLVAEHLNVGYWKSALLFAGLIAVVFAAHRFTARLNAVLAFWIAYILTRPLGASIGDYLSQDKDVGGLALGTTVTSLIFLVAILITVVYLTVTGKDRIETDTASGLPEGTGRHVLIVANKAAATPALLKAVRDRASAGPASFFLLIPNPDHRVFDRSSHEVRLGEQVLELARPLLQEASGGAVQGRVATSPNAYDDVVRELETGTYDEVILSTLPAHVSHWLHLDLPRRIADLGYPVHTVTPA